MYEYRAMKLRGVAFVVLVVLLASVKEGTEAKKDGKKTDDCYKPCVRGRPVCGNDGRNYSTGCHLSVARCRARKIGQRIYAVNTGYCQSSKPKSLCLLNCTRRRAPLCASDRTTYKNLCHFKKAKCERRKMKLPPITVLSRRGPCNKILHSCRSFASCPKVNRPACGSDGKTYKNICHLKTTNCNRKRSARGRKYKRLILKHCGACGRAKVCASSAARQKCPPVHMCDFMLRPAIRYWRTRKTSGNSETSGGKKRSSRVPPARKVKNAKRIKPKKKAKGVNVKRLKPTRKRPSQKVVKKPNPLNRAMKKPSAINRKKQYQVCGSDGQTYPSLCHLQVAQCNKMKKCQRLQMKHKGPCKKRSRT